MLNLNQESIKLGATATDKLDAIRQVGRLLVDSGQMKPDYINSMMAREQVANTFLGNGIAIPHGLPKDRDLILETGIAVLQVPNGVTWNPGETVHLVVGIAAKSDEHLEILANLTHLLSDETAVQQLSHTTNPLDVIKQLTDRSPDSVPTTDQTSPEPDFAKAITVTLPGKAGLHARPATALVNLAKTFSSEVRLRYGNQTANAKSLVALLKLGVEGGQTIRLMAQGPDEDEALDVLQRAIAAGLEDEDEESIPVSGGQRLSFEAEAVPGIPASPGLAIAPIYQLKRGKIVFASTAADPAAEELYLRQAIESAKLQLQELYESVKAKAGAAKAAIFEAHQEFLNDSELLQEAITPLSASVKG
jgi:phosphocarrier protein FPr